jgi:glycosyltransferase involved in cell wall biosynthesis
METAASISYSIVIPVYNTTWILGQLLQRIEQVFTAQIRQSYEIILVDDHSPNPETWLMVEALVRKGQHIRAIRLARNFGQHSAILCGLVHARGKYIITMDDDLQHAPEDIPALIGLQEHDVVIGQFLLKQHSWSRNLFSSIKAYFDRMLSGKPRHLHITTFCLIRQGVAQRMAGAANTPRPLLSSLIFYATNDVVGVAVSHSPRQEGESGYSLIRLIRLFSRLLVNNSRRIFQFVAWCGGVLFAISMLLLLPLSAGLLFHKDIPGWFLMGLVILLCNGLLLAALGFLGIVFARMEAIAEGKKPYLIQQHI